MNDETAVLVVQQVKTGAENHLLNDDVVQQVAKTPIERRKSLVSGENRAPWGPS